MGEVPLYTLGATHPHVQCNSLDTTFTIHHSTLGASRARNLQGYLAPKEDSPPRTLQYDYPQGPMVVPGRGAISYGRGTPVHA